MRPFVHLSSLAPAALIGLACIATPSRGASTITPIAVLLTPATASPEGSYWSDLRTPSIDREGAIAFRGFVVENPATGGPNAAYRTSTNQYIARSGEQAPGLAVGVKFDSIANFQMNPGGAAAFMGYIGPEAWSWSSGIWAESQDRSVRLVAMSGAPLPGVPDGTTLRRFPDAVADNPIAGYGLGSAPFVVNARGETAFFGQLDQPNAPQSSEGVWSEGGGGGLHLIAMRGTSIPQYSPGATVVSIVTAWDAIRINDHGQSTFAAIVTAPNLNTGGGVGVFVDDPEKGLLVAARSGEAAPGVPDGRFQAFSMPSLNSAGQLVFFARHEFADANHPMNDGIWTGLPGNFSLVAQTGDPAPGVDGVFANFTPWLEVPAHARPVINGRGEVAFTARITGPGVDDSNDSGIWIRDISGNVKLAAREGDVAPGERVLGDVAAYSGSLILNNRGQVAFGDFNGLWATDVVGNLHNIVAEGDYLPGFTQAERFGISRSTGNEDGRASSFNDRGELVFYSYGANFQTGVFLSTAVAIPEPSAATATLIGWCMLASCRRLARKTATR